MDKYCSTGQASDDNTVHGIACWIPKSTNTCSEYVLLIHFSLQQLIHECSSMLCCTYIVCLVVTCIQFFDAKHFWKGYVCMCVFGILISTITDHTPVTVRQILHKLKVIRLRCLC